MLDREEAARELLVIHRETEELPAIQRLATRIERISELQCRANAALRSMTASEALSLAQASIPGSLELHRCSRAEYILVWSDAYKRLFGESTTEWLLEIQNLFEWARSHCEEAGEIDFRYVYSPFGLVRRGKWVPGIRF